MNQKTELADNLEGATALDIYNDVKATALLNRTAEPRLIGAMSPGVIKNGQVVVPPDAVRQGDLYLIAIAEVPEDCEEVDVKAQLAAGDTQGSRHDIRECDLGRVRMYRRKSPNALQGPIFECLDATQDNPAVITHPEHGHIHFQCPGIIEVQYQRSLAEELKAVRD